MTFFGLGLAMGQNGAALAGGTSYEAEATALFARFSTDPGTTRKNAINTCIASLKSAGVWAKLDALWVMAAHEQASAILNWKSTSYGLTIGPDASFTTDQGITCASGVQAGNGNFAVPITSMNENGLTNYQQNSAHLSVWARSSAAWNGFAIGNAADSGTNLNPRWSDNNCYGRVNGASELSGFTVATGAGHSLANRSAANDRQVYRDGASLGSSTSDASRGLSVHSLGIFGPLATGQMSAASVGGSLNSTEVTAFYNALNTLKTAIGW